MTAALQLIQIAKTIFFLTILSIYKNKETKQVVMKEIELQEAL